VVGRFGFHAQCPGDRVEDFGGGVSVATLLQALQVLAADAGQHGQFVAPEPRKPPSRPRYQSHLGRCHPRAPCPQVIAQVVGLAHVTKRKGRPAATSLSRFTQPWLRLPTIDIGRAVPGSAIQVHTKENRPNDHRSLPEKVYDAVAAALPFAIDPAKITVEPGVSYLPSPIKLHDYAVGVMGAFGSVVADNSDSVR